MKTKLGRKKELTKYTGGWLWVEFNGLPRFKKMLHNRIVRRKDKVLLKNLED